MTHNQTFSFFLDSAYVANTLDRWKSVDCWTCRNCNDRFFFANSLDWVHATWTWCNTCSFESFCICTNFGWRIFATDEFCRASQEHTPLFFGDFHWNCKRWHRWRCAAQASCDAHSYVWAILFSDCLRDQPCSNSAHNWLCKFCRRCPVGVRRNRRATWILDSPAARPRCLDFGGRDFVRKERRYRRIFYGNFTRSPQDDPLAQSGKILGRFLWRRDSFRARRSRVGRTQFFCCSNQRLRRSCFNRLWRIRSSCFRHRRHGRRPL